MLYAPSNYTGDGSSTNFAVPFPYLAATDVYVFVGGVSTAFTFVASNLITISPAPALGAPIQILRQTANTTRSVIYADGVALTAQLLNSADDQLFYMAQEAFVTANASSAIQSAAISAGQAAASKALADADVIAAAASATAAAASATAAAGYAGGLTSLPVQINAATETAIADADELPVLQTSGGALIKRSWLNVKAQLNTYFATIFAAIAHTHTFASLTFLPTTLAGFGITDAAPLASPALTGVPTAPTAATATSTTQVASTAFVQAVAAAIPAGGQPIPTSSTFAVGTFAALANVSGGSVTSGATVAGSGLKCGLFQGSTVTLGSSQSGTWRNVGGYTCLSGGSGGGDLGYFVRTL